MADVSTPSAMAMSVGTGFESARPDESKAATAAAAAKPEKPDEATFKTAEAKKRKELEDAKVKTKDLEAKFNASKPNNKDSPSGQRQAELKADLAAIRSKQQAHKSSRSGVQERVGALDAQLKAKIADQKAARSRNPFKSAEEIEQRIAALTQQVDSGKMKIVDEKKSLSEISSLNRQKKDFAGYDAKQKEIDALKAQIAETKKEYDNPESRALSADYDAKQAELNALRAEQDASFKSRDTHKEAFHAARARQNALYGELKGLQDAYYGAKRAFDSWERDAKRQHYARKKAEGEARDLERKRRGMAEELEDARAPAYLEHINACNALIRILDRSSTVLGRAAVAISQFAATAQRVVDDSGIKGTRLSSKKDEEEESYFVGTGGKKGKKGRKGPRGGAAPAAAAGEESAATPTTKAVDIGLFYSPGVSDHFEKIGVQPPSSAEDQPRALEEIKEKKKWYEENQDKKTEENIAAVQKRFERLEAGAGSSEGANGAGESKTNGQAAATNGTAEAPSADDTATATNGEHSKSEE